MVECESLVERDALYLIDYSPGVKFYQEQPALVMYESHNEMKRYYPDFGVTFKSEAMLHIEVKPESELTKPHLIKKFEAIIRRYQSESTSFLILTEKVIRKEPLFSNLKEIYKNTKVHLDIQEVIQQVKVLLQTNIQYTLNDLVVIFSKKEVMMLLAQYVIFCDLYQSLWSPTNFVRLFEEADHEALFF